MIGLAVMAAIIVAANVIGWIAGAVIKDPRAEDRWTAYAYACAIGALTGIIW